MKIVFLSVASQGGGAEEALHDLVAGLQQKHRDWDLRVICGENGPLVDRFHDISVPVEVINFPASFGALGESWLREPWCLYLAAKNLSAAFQFARYCVRLWARIKEAPPDVVYSTGLKMHLASTFAVPRASFIVWHLHDYIGNRRICANVLPRLGYRMRLILANSRHVALDARALWPKKRVEVVENAVDVDRFQPEGATVDLDELANLPKAPPETLRIGLVATFAHWKGQELFLQAIAKLPKGLPVRAYIIGGPIETSSRPQWTLDELSLKARKLGVEVGFTGWIKDTPAAFRSLDIVVQASTNPEPFGLVIIQALACGRPVVVSGEGGAADVVSGLPDVLMFTPRDAQSLANTLMFLINHPEKREAAKTSGPMSVRARFTRDRLAGQVSNHLRNLLENPSY